MIVLCEASYKFHRKNFQNDRFARGFLQISQKKLPKRAFRARPPPNFTEKASKTIVSRQASSNFHRNSFQNERFARGLLQVSQKKLPKRSFRARPPPIFTEEASKMIVSREASYKFHRKSFQNARGLFQILQKKLPKRAFHARPPNFHRRSFQSDRFARSDEKVAPSTEKFAFRHSFGRPTSTKRRKGCASARQMSISPQVLASDEHEVTRGLTSAI